MFKDKVPEEIDLNGLTLTNSNNTETMRTLKGITNDTFSYEGVQNLCQVSTDSNLTKTRAFYDQIVVCWKCEQLERTCIK